MRPADLVAALEALVRDEPEHRALKLQSADAMIALLDGHAACWNRDSDCGVVFDALRELLGDYRMRRRTLRVSDVRTVLADLAWRCADADLRDA